MFSKSDAISNEKSPLLTRRCNMDKDRALSAKLFKKLFQWPKSIDLKSRNVQVLTTDPKEQFKRGNAYHYGQNGKKNLPLAAVYYEQAASQGYAPAQCNLGSVYYYGVGVEKDFTLAIKWFKKAAQQGEPNARDHLAKARKAKENGYRRLNLIDLVFG